MRTFNALAPLLSIFALVFASGCTGSASSAGPNPGISSGTVSGAAHLAPPLTSVSTGASCPLRPACDAPFSGSYTKRPFVHKRSSLVVEMGSARHRGRDLFLRPGDPAWVLAKFAYGASDKDLSDEEVDLWLQRGCSGAWEALGTFKTTPGEGNHAPVLGVEDKGGQIFLDINTIKLPAGPLGIGRHRVHLQVAGDGSSTDLILEVLPAGAKVVVSDIDGTLTESENAIVKDVVADDNAAANPGAADVLKTLAERGFLIFYLTARPFWLVPKTRKWLAMRGFPPGIVHTSLSNAGYGGEEAAAFKSAELKGLKSNTGIVPDMAFGNKPSDVDTYSAMGIAAAQSYYFKLEGDAKGGVRHEDYRMLLSGLSARAGACP